MYKASSGESDYTCEGAPALYTARRRPCLCREEDDYNTRNTCRNRPKTRAVNLSFKFKSFWPRGRTTRIGPLDSQIKCTRNIKRVYVSPSTINIPT